MSALMSAMEVEPAARQVGTSANGRSAHAPTESAEAKTNPINASFILVVRPRFKFFVHNCPASASFCCKQRPQPDSP